MVYINVCGFSSGHAESTGEEFPILRFIHVPRFKGTIIVH